MYAFLRYSVILSFLISLISLSILIVKTFSYGRKQFLAKPDGKISKGIFYALGQGILPWEKESTRRHLLTYVTGIFYHLGIFSGIFYIASVIIPFHFNHYFIFIVQIFLFVGIICGLGLLTKRIFITSLRLISCPDDYISNILVNLFLIIGLLDTFTSSINIFYFLSTIILLLYIPFGKIRHCFFFFYSRILFGIFFGRRSVLPQKQYQLRIKNE